MRCAERRRRRRRRGGGGLTVWFGLILFELVWFGLVWFLSSCLRASPGVCGCIHTRCVLLHTHPVRWIERVRECVTRCVQQHTHTVRWIACFFFRFCSSSSSSCVIDNRPTIPTLFFFLFFVVAAGRAVPEPGSRVRAGDGLQRGEALPQEQADPADAAGQAVPLPARQSAGAHSRPRDLPPGHQAAESAARSTGACKYTAVRVQDTYSVTYQGI